MSSRGVGHELLQCALATWCASLFVQSTALTTSSDLACCGLTACIAVVNDADFILGMRQLQRTLYCECVLQCIELLCSCRCQWA